MILSCGLLIFIDKEKRRGNDFKWVRRDMIQSEFIRPRFNDSSRINDDSIENDERKYLIANGFGIWSDRIRVRFGAIMCLE